MDLIEAKLEFVAHTPGSMAQVLVAHKGLDARYKVRCRDGLGWCAYLLSSRGVRFRCTVRDTDKCCCAEPQTGSRDEWGTRLGLLEQYVS